MTSKAMYGNRISAETNYTNMKDIRADHRSKKIDTEELERNTALLMIKRIRQSADKYLAQNDDIKGAFIYEPNAQEPINYKILNNIADKLEEEFLHD